MADDDNVISLPVGDRQREHNQRESEIADLPVSSQPSYSLDTCKHSHSIVDSNARTVICSSCNVPLDPIDVLDEIARDFAAPLRLAQRAKAQVRNLRASIEQLTREERNAKARVRTARKRALRFDADAIDAAVLARYEGRRLDDRQYAYARNWMGEVIEAYIGVLNEEGNHEVHQASAAAGPDEVCDRVSAG